MEDDYCTFTHIFYQRLCSSLCNFFVAWPPEESTVPRLRVASPDPTVGSRSGSASDFADGSIPDLVWSDEFESPRVRLQNRYKFIEVIETFFRFHRMVSEKIRSDPDTVFLEGRIRIRSIAGRIRNFAKNCSNRSFLPKLAGIGKNQKIANLPFFMETDGLVFEKIRIKG